MIHQLASSPVTPVIPPFLYQSCRRSALPRPSGSPGSSTRWTWPRSGVPVRRLGDIGVSQWYDSKLAQNNYNIINRGSITAITILCSGSSSWNISQSSWWRYWGSIDQLGMLGIVQQYSILLRIYTRISANAWVLPGPAMTTGDAASSSSSELNPYWRSSMNVEV